MTVSVDPGHRHFSGVALLGKHCHKWPVPHLPPLIPRTTTTTSPPTAQAAPGDFAEQKMVFDWAANAK
jgi:hypothetical protein